MILHLAVYSAPTPSMLRQACAEIKIIYKILLLLSLEHVPNPFTTTAIAQDMQQSVRGLFPNSNTVRLEDLRLHGSTS